MPTTDETTAKLDRLFVPLAEQPYRWFEAGLKTWELPARGRQFTSTYVRVVAEVAEAPSIEAFFDRVPWQQIICTAGIADRREAEKVAADILGVFSDVDAVIGFRVDFDEDRLAQAADDTVMGQLAGNH